MVLIGPRKLQNCKSEIFSVRWFKFKFSPGLNSAGQLEEMLNFYFSDDKITGYPGGLSDLERIQIFPS